MGYCQNNPTRWIDPVGHEFEEAMCVAELASEAADEGGIEAGGEAGTEGGNDGS
jgi:hypothetical protein